MNIAPIGDGQLSVGSRRKLGLWIMPLLLVLLVGGCAGPSPASAPGVDRQAEVAKKEPQRGGTLKMTACNFAHQDVHQNLANTLHQCLGLAYSGLLRYETGPDVPATSARIIPDMAEKWEQTSPTTLIFHLRKDVKWQNLPPVNGRAFTADDVVYSVNRLRTPGWVHSSLWTALDKIEALDPYTVKMTLKEPSAPFLSMVAHGYSKMVAKEAVDLSGDLKNGPTIGTGPFILDKLEGNQRADFKRNPEFYEKGLPYLDGLRLLYIADAATALSAFRTKQLDYHELGTNDVDMVQRTMPDVKMVEYKQDACTFLGLKNNRAPFDDQKLRAAVSKAINRQEIIDTIYFGKQWVNTCIPAPDLDWQVSEDRLKGHYKYDPDGAKKLLAEAGYPNGLQVEMWVASSDSYLSPAQLVQAQLEKVGIKVKLNINEYNIYTAQILTKPGNYQHMAFGPTGTFAEPDQWLSTFFHSQGARNAQEINDPKLDQMIDAQRKELDQEKRRKLILDIENYILDQYYQVVLYGYWNTAGLWPWVQDFSPLRDYGGFRQYRLYWFDKSAPGYLGG